MTYTHASKGQTPARQLVVEVVRAADPTRAGEWLVTADHQLACQCGRFGSAQEQIAADGAEDGDQDRGKNHEQASDAAAQRAYLDIADSHAPSVPVTDRANRGAGHRRSLISSVRKRVPRT